MMITGYTTCETTENIFKHYILSGKEIYLNEIMWSYFKSKYDQEFLIQQLSDAIKEYNVPLPYRSIGLIEVKHDYQALRNLLTEFLIQEGKWSNKFEYRYPFMDKYIDMTNYGNKASDFFHQVERWKCDATGYPSPQKTWETEQYRLTLLKALFSLKVKEINSATLRNIISLRKYIAAQFRPSVAKAIYEMFEAKTVLDFSMGWGDRIAGAHASSCVEKYVGIDPNKNLFEGYNRQFRTYDSLNRPLNKQLICGCAEDPNIVLEDEFDLVFTSPPYFDKEKYDQSENQSYKKHKGFDAWMDNFLCKAIELRTRNLKSGGHLAININDIYTRKKLYQICDRMNDFIASTNQFTYLGAIGMRTPKRPMSISADKDGIYGEPIWIWKKK